MAENLVGNSTILEPAPGAMALGGGAPVIADIKDKGADDYKPQSVADVLTAEAKRLNEEEAAEQKAVKDKAAKASEDAKAKVSEKERAEKDAETKAKADRARANDGKFAKAKEPDDGDEETDQEGEQPKKTDEQEQEQEKSRRPRSQEETQRENEKRRYAVVAERFTPEARAKWDNVPHPVKAELFRLSQERDTEIQRYRQSHERYEQFRQFDEIARTNGRDLRQSLEKVVAVERALAANPISGLDMILREVGPRKPDGQPLSLYEVAQHIVSRGPQAYQQMTAQTMVQPQQRQPDPEIAALRQELAAMKTEQTVVPVVNSFAQSHPDFEQLAPQIKAILESKVIDGIYGSGLSYEQKLSEAYRMAGGRASMQQMPEDTDETHSEVAARPVNPDAGKKSVRGAPSNGADTATDDRETDLREMLRKEMRKLTA